MRHVTTIFCWGHCPTTLETWFARSPLRHAERLQNPLAIFHGNQDTVVHFEQAEAVAQSLKRRGIPILYKVMDGAGHSFRKAEHLQDYFNSMHQFLQFHLIHGIQG
ncbi:MAG UNVERIFIED_CONTAM: prolyl oligopeptidase family serine peptidase [Anaerolineae bacterium]